ncbi:unnamed protein product [Vicia faba]|uniref:Uncharacterized protein n=1 Tax=Vicia faba TaxID=3906 RepID=A0AAV1AVD1_VICFA|nr:unnamed protein product [Vicia faba]
MSPALDGLVNVNSLFTIAVFVGLSLTTPGQRSLENRTSCDAGIDVEKKLLVYEVVLVQFLPVFVSSSAGFGWGCCPVGVNLLLIAVGVMVVLVSSALVMYISTAIYAFTH